MALLKGKLFAGALFAGALLSGQQEATIPVVQPPAQRAGYGGGYFPREATPIQQKKRVEVKDEISLAQLQAEDELMLHIIMSAVTQELI